MKRILALLLCMAGAFLAVGKVFAETPGADVTSGEARAMAREAFIYGYPSVEGYRVLYRMAVDVGGPHYKGPFNHIVNLPRLGTSEDRFVATPNADMMCSWLWLDLRAEPMVLTLPLVEGDRYYSVQFVDLLGFNIAYLGTRTTGNGAGNFLVAGPGWTGEKPEGIKAVIRCETALAHALYRTQVNDVADIDAVREIRARYGLLSLSQFLGEKAPKPAPEIRWPMPARDMTKTSEIFGYLNFVLQFCPTQESEKALMSRWAGIGIGTGKTFDVEDFSLGLTRAIKKGVADAWKDFVDLCKRMDEGLVDYTDFYGSRDKLHANNLYRFAGAKLGLFGDSREEVLCKRYFLDNDKQPLDGSKHRYVLRFEPGQLPPANAVWSVTAYDAGTELLMTNAINRYAISSTMMKWYNAGEDGSLTFYVQKDSPGAEREFNWLPAPTNSFFVLMRLYWPKPEALNGTWKPPPLLRVQ